MSETLTALEINAATGEEITRELTADEIAELEAIAAEQAQREAEALAREELRQSAIANLVAGKPLTAEQAELLVIK